MSYFIQLLSFFTLIIFQNSISITIGHFVNYKLNFHFEPNFNEMFAPNFIYLGYDLPCMVYFQKYLCFYLLVSTFDIFIYGLLFSFTEFLPFLYCFENLISVILALFFSAFLCIFHWVVSLIFPRHFLYFLFANKITLYFQIFLYNGSFAFLGLQSDFGFFHSAINELSFHIIAQILS